MGKVSRRKRGRFAASAPPVQGSAAAGFEEAQGRRLSGVGSALVVVAAVVVYANSLGGDLLFDDLNAIVNNRLVREFDVGRILATASWWGELGYGRLYRPVTTLSFALNCAAGGLDPLGYHIVNVALHAATSWLLAALLVRLSGDPWLSTLASLLFAVHPVHTEAVASVVGRAEELSAFFALASWLLLLRGREVSQGRGWWVLLSGLALAAGFLAKENAATVVGAVVCADLIYYHRYGDSPARVLGRWVRQYLALVVVILALVAWRAAVVGALVSRPEQMDNVLATAAWPARSMTAVAVVARYFAKLAWPFDLAADYSYRQIDLVGSARDPWFLSGCLLLAGAWGAMVWGLRRRSEAALAVTFSITTFSLASNLLVVIGTIMAERLLYLPSAGFCLLVAVTLDASAQALLGKGRARVVATVAAALLALAWSFGTWERNRVWRDPLTFFQAMVRDAPLSARSHRELGLTYSRLGRHEEALAEIDRSLAIKPKDAATLYNLGNVLMRAGRPGEAIDAYRRSLARKPDFVEAMTNLANAYSAAGDERSAESWFRKGLGLAPNSAAINMNLANSLFRQGRLEEAEERYRLALSLDPRAANIRTNYGSLLYAQGKYLEAAEQYRRATVLEPRSPAGYVGLVAALAEAGEQARAKQVLAVAAGLFPGDPGVERMRALVEGKGGR